VGGDRRSQQPGGDRAAPERHRLTVAEAAEALGITVEAVRSRIKRGTLESAKEANTTYVFVDTDRARPDTDRVTDRTEALISTLEDQVTHLRAELEEAHSANRENRRIIAALTQRIPELEAPSEPRASPTEPPSGADTVEARPAGGEAQEGVERVPWWRRMFKL
jgi:predicted ArsR family transcriptional regulator